MERSQLIITIENLNASIAEAKEATRQAHVAIKELKIERKVIERLLGSDIKELVNTRASEVIKAELDQLGPGVRKQTSLIYDKVGEQIDKLISISLGNEFASKRDQQDLRPIVAAKLRQFIEEVIESVPATPPETSTATPTSNGEL